MKRSDFFRGAWLSPLALVPGLETFPNPSSTIDAERGAALAQVLTTDVLNVEAFGAVGDGSADDSVPVQAAITAAAVSGGTVFFPVGTYLVTSALSMSSNVSLVGASRAGSIIRLGANIGTALIAIGAISDVHISNLRLEGQRGSNTSPSNDAVGRSTPGGGASRITISNVEIDSFAGAGVSFLATVGAPDSDISVLDSRVTNTGTHGIVCQDYVHNVQVRGNYIADWGLDIANRIGVIVGRSSVDQIVANNIIVGSASALGTSVHGVSMDGTTRATVVGNTISNCISFGIEVGNSIQCTVVGNSITPRERAGIGVSGSATDSSPQTVVTGNLISGGTGQGIYVFGASSNVQKYILITDNVIIGGSIGIQFDWVQESVISDNLVRNCTLSGIFIGAAGNTDNKISCTGNHLADNNTDAHGSHGGLRINTADAARVWLVRDNLVYGSGVRDYHYTQAGALISARTVNRDTTPSVALEDGFDVANSRATTITDFDDGHEGQLITLRFEDANTRIRHRAGVMELQGATDFTPTARDTLTLRRITGRWAEVGRAAI